VDAADDPEAALDLCIRRRTPVDLLLTDVIMPRMSGGELASRVRAQRPDLRVLFMSGYTADRFARKGDPEDEVAFLQKPFNAEELLHAVRNALDAVTEG
jgi:YesN/AraC family two-component response regulator